METCHALARRGHFVSLVVRPDTQSPSRNPFEFYGLPLIARFTIEYAPVSGPPFARRAGYLAFAIGRMLGASRTDVVMTRDLGVGSALLRVPRTLRPPVVYESHGYAPDVAAALPEMISTANPPSATKIRRLERREAFVWRSADGYITITAGLAAELEQRFGGRRAVAVVPDGTRIAADQGRATVEDRRPVIVYAGHLYAWKGVDVLLEALRELGRCSRTDRRRTREGAGPCPAARTSGAARDCGSGDVHWARGTAGRGGRTSARGAYWCCRIPRRRSPPGSRHR